MPKIYQVEKILEKKTENGKPYYLVKWVGWAEKDSTWEPLNNLTNVMHMVNEFEKNAEDGKSKVPKIMKALPGREVENLIFEERESVPGNLNCDIPDKIANAKFSGNELLCLIDWKKRYDGTKPLNSYVSNKILRNFYPKLLIDYYESKIKCDKI